MRGRVVLNVAGALAAFTGLTMLPSAAVSLLYGEAVWPRILLAAVVTSAAGGLLFLGTRPVREISRRDGFAIVALSWAAAAAFGALPYLFTGAIPSVTGAFFESMSGFTTTGSTVVTEIDRLPRGIVLWRSQTQWMGGMGIIVLSIAILPLLGIGGMQLMEAEIPGLTADRLRPRVRQTAALLWVVYTLFTAVEALLLVAGGMTAFEAVNHALTTMATGGFSTEDTSIGAFQNPFVQYVIVAFMAIAGINFTLHYCWLGGNWRALKRNSELRAYLWIMAISTVLLTLLVRVPGTMEGTEESFRASLFQAVSMMTTTGYATADYERWVPAAQVLLFLLMLVGGCTGSTAGSVKVLRHLLVAKIARISLRRLIHPQGVFVYKLDGNKVVTDEALAGVSGFLLFYLGALGAGVLTLALLGVDVATAIGAAGTTIGNVGPGFGLVGPSETFSGLPIPAYWILAFLMLLGRLELFTVLVLFTRGYWRK